MFVLLFSILVIGCGLSTSRYIAMNILDIDLDFFLDIPAYMLNVASEERLDENEHHPWQEIEVISFLENQCKLSPNRKIIGKFFTNHIEVFYFLRSLQEINNYQLLFNIDHIDAHADLGLGDASYEYICTDLLKYDVKYSYKNIREL